MPGGRLRKRPGLPGGRPGRSGPDQWQDTMREYESRADQSVLPFGMAFKTSAKLQSSQHDLTFTNEGATGAVTLSLPAARPGLRFHFYVHAAQTLQISATDSNTIQADTLVSAANGNVSCASKGSAITLEAVNLSEWMTRNLVGTWTVT